MHPPRIDIVQVNQLSFNVKVAMYQGNNFDIRHFFHRGHLDRVMVQKQIQDFPQFWAKMGSKSLLLAKKS